MITICPTINTKCATIRCNTKVSHLIITFALPMCWAKLTMDTTHSFVLTSGDPKRDLIDPDVIDPNVLGQLDIVWEFLLLSFLWLLYRTTPIGLYYFLNYHLMTVSMLTEGLLMTALRMLDTWYMAASTAELLLLSTTMHDLSLSTTMHARDDVACYC